MEIPKEIPKIQDPHKKTLMFNVLMFLQQELRSEELSAVQKGSIDIAIECLGNAYEISSGDEQVMHKIDLLAHVRFLNQGLPEEQLLLSEHHRILGNEAMRCYNYQEAAIEYSIAIDTNPKKALNFCNRAAAYTALRNNNEAIIDCNQAIILDHTCSEAYDRLGIIHSRTKNWEEAVKAYMKSLKINPQDTSTQNNLRLATERLSDTMENNVPRRRGRRPIHASPSSNAESLVTIARGMLMNVQFQDIIWASWR